MKNLILLTSLPVLFLTASCKKCETCSYTNSSGQKQVLNKVCGNKSLLEDYEKECNEQAKFFNTECNCETE
jgi:hypothetical protein